MNKSAKIQSWSESQPPTESTIRRIFASEGLQPSVWSNAPHDVYAAHSHLYHKVIYCVEGSITFGLPDTGEKVVLRPGDRLELPPGMRHDAVVGPEGVLCLEAHRSATSQGGRFAASECPVPHAEGVQTPLRGVARDEAMSEKLLVAHRSLLIAIIALLVCVLIATGAAALNRDNIRGFLYNVTGEEELEHQVRGFPQWLSGATRPQPQTADFVPIAYNGVNPFGVNTFLNQEVEEQKRARQLDMIRDAGFKWIRQEFPWEDIEIHAKGDFMDRRNPPKIVSAWDKYDGIVRMANARGIQVIARLSTPPKWSRKDQNAIATTPPDNLKDFGDFVDAAVTHYKGQITFYQIWNEPNVYPEWGDQDISPGDYVELLKVGYTRAKAVDPDVVILAAPLAPTIELGPRDMNDFIFLQRMYDAGAKNFFDILSIQDYGLWWGPNDRRMRPRVLNFSRPIYIRDIMVQNGDEHKAIWASEIGWNAIPKDHPAYPQFGRVSDEQAARYATAAYARAQSEWPWMGVMVYWFFKRASDAEQAQPFYYFKMLNPDFKTLPVYEALKQYANQPPVIYPGYFQEDHWAIKAEGQWPIVNDPKAVLGKYRSSARKFDDLSFTFVGSGLDVVFVKGLAGGLAKVSIDERAPVEINLAATKETFGEKSQIVRGLPKGQHKVTIEVVSAVVGVDGVVVYP